MLSPQRCKLWRKHLFPQRLVAVSMPANVADTHLIYIPRSHPDVILGRIGEKIVPHSYTGGRHHVVIRKLDCGNRCAYTCKTLAQPTAFITHRILFFQTPASPLHDDAFRHVAHYLQAVAGEISEQRHCRWHKKIPEKE